MIIAAGKAGALAGTVFGIGYLLEMLTGVISKDVDGVSCRRTKCLSLRQIPTGYGFPCFSVGRKQL
jgi:hypothetical protein